MIPDTAFYTRVRDETITPNPFRWDVKTSKDIFAGRTVIVFALPGAFTPTCSDFHLPGYEKDYDEFRKFGVDEVHCLAVNDAFVMFQWAKHLDITKVQMLPDGNADFTSRMGMLVNKHQVGFGYRSHRYSMLVKDGVIVKMFVEEKDSPVTNDPYKVSDSQTMLKYLKSSRRIRLRCPPKTLT